MRQARIWMMLGVMTAALDVVSPAAAAETPVGTVAAVQGVLEIQRGRAWAPLGSGDDIALGVHLRTAPGARAKILLKDDSVIDLGATSDLSIETLETQPGRRQALLRLNKGKVHAWVSESYKEPKARFEVETPTAVAGAHGTEFLVVYSPETELTEVVGVDEEVQVFGKLAVLSGGVEVGPNAYTQVQKGRFPTQAQELDALRFHQFFEGLELRGTGRRDGLNVEHPLVEGRLLSPDDVPATAMATQEPLAETGGRPLPPLAYTYSQDVYTNRQPLLQYRLVPPGRAVSSGPGGVVVDF